MNFKKPNVNKCNSCISKRSKRELERERKRDSEREKLTANWSVIW